MNLPQKFYDRMKKKPGDFPAFLRSYEDAPAEGVRVNTLKISAAQFRARFPELCGESVPWGPDGFYTPVQKVGGLPAYHAGLFYSQEPSAMCAAPLLNVQPGERVLDYCAAPGGKSVQLACALQGRGLLLSNEYDRSRAGILSGNLERMGVGNAIVHAGAISVALPAFFDKILVDAPCSGEGMFRKDPDAIAHWSEENVARCAARQAAILDLTAEMLRAGGRMVYSTCTFSDEENEGQIEAFLRRHPDYRCLSQRRLMPHEVRGEGHFAALLERIDGGGGSIRAENFGERPSSAAMAAFGAFSEEFFTRPFAGQIRALKTAEGEVLFSPPDAALPALGGVLRAGIELGRTDRKIFRPAHALAMWLKPQEVQRFVSLGEEESRRFLRGEVVESTLPDGWCVVGFEAFPLGIGKIVGGQVKNHYPKGLRLIR